MLDAGFRLQKRACVADEHYVPTLLAVHGLDNQVITMSFGKQWELLCGDLCVGVDIGSL